MAIKHWIAASRLRTLPLSVSGIIVGSGLANFTINTHPVNYNLTECFGCIHIYKDYLIFTIAILTTIGFQVLSNFANDYGDGIKGTDKKRVGEQRMVASGKIKPKTMKKALYITAFITLCLAITLIYKAFDKNDFVNLLLFFALGIISIIAAIKYTVGKNPYGYSGLGDLFVFLFFGLLSIMGSYYLYTHTFNRLILLPAIAFGALSTAVLNLNNMRDQIQDKKAGKNTLVVKMGSQKAKIYHYALIISALLLLLLYKILTVALTIKDFIFLIAFIPLFLNIKTVAQNIIYKDLDNELKKVAIATFLCALLYII